jgi:conjugative relaxase-like TrwC/TraI family protein
MFTSAKIKDGSTYLGNHLSANDYYSKGETVQGVWVGKAAEVFDLAGQKIASGNLAFENLRNNRMPFDEHQKLTPRDTENRVKFFDFQCSAQKSVSIMAVTMGDERLLAAHDRAAAKAFGELERFASCQAGSGLGKHNELTGNVCAAAFRHTASRALDPQVHTHFVVANATWDSQRGRWVALNEHEMVKAVRYAGKVYQNELALEVQRLGYEINRTGEKGRVTGFEIKGVSADICQRFSKRRAEVEAGIEKFKREKGRSPTPGETHVITTETRDPKLKEITTPEVLARQRGELQAQELRSLETLKGQALKQMEVGISLEKGSKEAEVLTAAVSHLYERKSVLQGHEILAEALNSGLGSMDLDRLKVALNSNASSLVELARVPENQTLSASFATRDGLQLEHWAVSFVNRTRGTSPSLGNADFTLSAGLSDEQRTAALEILSQKDQVYALRGVAGAGKTRTLSEIHRALEVSGKKVFYAAPTAAAAKVLQAEGFSNATTVTDFLQNVSKKEDLSRSVFIVDEAGLQSNKQGVELLRLAEKNKARVIFVGDSRQHVAVEAGDFLRVLENHSRLGVSELKDIRRQRLLDYNLAVRAMATGKAAAGMEALDRMGWIHEGKEDYIRTAARDYVRLAQGQDGPKRVVLVTPTWAENHLVTDEIRTELKREGKLGSGKTIEVLDSLKWTLAQRKAARNYTPGQVVVFHQNAYAFKRGEAWEVSRVDAGTVWARTAGGPEKELPLHHAAKFDVQEKRQIEVATGDRLLIRANDKTQHLVNGDTLTVRQVHRDGSIECENGRVISKEFRAFTHGYAVTSHKAQGRTAEHVVVCASRLDAKTAYVACSRARETCTVHTPDKEKLFEGLPQSGARLAALDVIKKETLLPDPNIQGRAQKLDVAQKEEQSQRAKTLRQVIERHSPGYSVKQRSRERGFGPGL